LRGDVDEAQKIALVFRRERNNGRFEGENFPLKKEWAI
jgi:hypothetical protein